MKIKDVIILLLIGIGLGIGLTMWGISINKAIDKSEIEEATLKWKVNHFKLNEDNLKDELIAQGVAFPDIVKAQALLETDSFKSYSCITSNNLFGFRYVDSSYISFSHWTESVAAYKSYVQRWDLPPNDYYNYLDSLGYSKDSNYTKVLKHIVN